MTELLAGAEVELQWVDLIPHSTSSYLIEFYAGPDTPRKIVDCLDATQYSLLWQLPSQPCDECSLVVTQINDGADYAATLRFSIVDVAGPVEMTASPTPAGDEASAEAEATGLEMRQPPADEDGMSGVSRPQAPVPTPSTATTNVSPGVAEPDMSEMQAADGFGCALSLAAPSRDVGMLSIGLLAMAVAFLRRWL